MAEKSGKSKEYFETFALDEQILRRLVDIISTAAGKLPESSYIQFSISRSDDSFYSTRDIDELLAEDNSTGRTIERLSIELNPDRAAEPDTTETKSSESVAYVAFRRGSGTGDRIVYFATHPERSWSLLLADEIDAQVRRTFRQRLRWMPAWADSVLVLFLLALAITAPLVYSSVHRAQMGIVTPTNFAKLSLATKLDELYRLESVWFGENTAPFLAFTIAPLVLTMVALTTRPVAALRRKLRRSYFLWGDQISQAATRDKIETGVFWALGVGVLASLIASIIFALFGKIPRFW